MDLFDTLTVAIFTLMIINNSLFVIHFKKLQVPFTLIFIYLLLTLSTETLALILRKNDINNLPLLHIFTFLEFIILSLFLTKANPKLILRQEFSFSLIILIAGFIVYNSLFLQSLHEFNSYAKTVSNFSLILFSIILLAGIQSTQESNKRSALIWINSGILLYFSSSLFIFLFSDTLVSLSFYSLRVALTVNMVLTILFQLILMIGFLLFFYQKENKNFLSNNK